MGQFRVIDLRSEVIEPEQFVEAGSPEEAARLALGESLVRGSPGRQRPVCRVYWCRVALNCEMRNPTKSTALLCP
jgi:hypothetical protein